MSSSLRPRPFDPEGLTSFSDDGILRSLRVRPLLFCRSSATPLCWFLYRPFLVDLRRFFTSFFSFDMSQKVSHFPSPRSLVQNVFPVFWAPCEALFPSPSRVPVYNFVSPPPSLSRRCDPPHSSLDTTSIGPQVFSFLLPGKRRPLSLGGGEETFSPAATKIFLLLCPSSHSVSKKTLS